VHQLAVSLHFIRLEIVGIEHSNGWCALGIGTGPFYQKFPCKMYVHFIYDAMLWQLSAIPDFKLPLIHQDICVCDGKPNTEHQLASSTYFLSMLHLTLARLVLCCMTA